MYGNTSLPVQGARSPTGIAPSSPASGSDLVSPRSLSGIGEGKGTDSAEMIHIQNLSLKLKRTMSLGNLAEGQVPRSARSGSAAHLKMWELMKSYLPGDSISIQQSICNYVEFTLARTRFNFDDFAAYQATAHSVRDRLIEHWNDTQQYWQDEDPKRVYYLSMEFLTGRFLQSNLINLDLQGNFKEAVRDLGFRMEALYVKEKDAALGNGGLGRLAACFLDSMATLSLPAWGYGLRYQYGMFEQKIINGHQVELPDYWLTAGNPWEIERLDVQYPVRFYGHIIQNGDKKSWVGGEVVQAVAYDIPIPGYDTWNVANLRLWSSKPAVEFNLQSFNEGDYFGSIESRQRAEGISSVLYPNDNTAQGKELRLKQQYFFASATLSDIVRRYLKSKRSWTDFPRKVAIQLNDTHPTISIPELMRILVDDHGLEWDFAWDICRGTFAYTNHTVLPEALEKWPVSLIERLLPRHMEIIYDINHFHLRAIHALYPGDVERMRELSIIEEGSDKSVRMAQLAIVGSHTTNGVAALHSQLLKETIFKRFYEMWPEKFQNKTNGVTPRRWILQANPMLSEVLTRWIGSSQWVTNLNQLQALREHADNPELQSEWLEVKRFNKVRLAHYIECTTGLSVDPDALFDVHVKRFHEYKRQLLNILGVIHRYLTLCDMSSEQRQKVVPRVVIFGGKAAPGYVMAKRIIKLINGVARIVNNDPSIGNLLKIVFISNYCVSNAEIIIPASDISQHISTAGTEASGTSNMKFSMNGGVILGTLDGANIEIRQEVGQENMFVFGALTEQVESLRNEVRFSSDRELDPNLSRVLSTIRQGRFGDVSDYMPLIDSITMGHDYYLVTVDFADYLRAQECVESVYVDRKRWAKMSILNTAGTGKFSTDRTIAQYAKEIWQIEACRRPDPSSGGTKHNK